jgi:polysaccharide biosynthesis/export protein VpsN
MRRPGYQALLALLLSSPQCSHQPENQRPLLPAVDVLPDESLGVDDVIEVRVIGETDLSGAFRISVDGTIYYPYVGQLPLSGLRPGEVQQLLTTKLKDGLLVSPQVIVTVKDWNSRKISVLGQVNKPGPISYYPHMTVVDAIAAAGGFTALAAQNSVKLRREMNGRVETATFRVNDISHGQFPNVIMMPKDVLYVDERLF